MGLFCKSNKELSDKTPVYDIDYERLAYAIVQAQADADKKCEEEKDKARKQSKENIRRALGEKDCPDNAGKFKKKSCEIQNALVSFWHMLFLRKKVAKDLYAATALAQAALAIIFGVCKGILYLGTIGLVAYAIIMRSQLGGWGIFIYLIWALACFIFARFFRLAKFEVDYMDDRQYLVGMLSAVASFLAMIFTLITVLMSINKVVP